MGLGGSKKIQREGCWRSFASQAKKELGVESGWLRDKAGPLVPLIDGLNHVGNYVKLLEEHANNADVSNFLSDLEDSICRTMEKISRKGDLPFNESTFRNFVRQFPAFTHRTTEEAKEDGNIEQTTKLMRWLKL